MLVKDLTGSLLDYWVARAMGYSENQMPRMKLPSGEWLAPHPHQSLLVEVWMPGGWHDEYEPSTRWDHGGPIIEQEHIELQLLGDDWGANIWPAEPEESLYIWSGPTPLIAAMRCYVASVYGDEVPDAD